MLACPTLGTVELACRHAVGAVFVLAGYVKWRRPDAAGRLIAELLPAVTPHASLGVRAIGTLEVAVGILLLAGVWVPLASTLGILMLTAFSAALTVLLRRGFNGTCGCFGADDELSAVDVWRNLLLLTGSGLVYAASFRGEPACAMAPVWSVNLASLGTSLVTATAFTGVARFAGRTLRLFRLSMEER